MKPVLVVFLAVLFALFPLVVHADDGDRKGLLLRINGDLDLPRGESVNSVIVVRGDAAIRGTVADNLVVIDGTAVIEGAVNGHVTVISGDLDLRGGATVKDVNLIRSDLVRAPGATITGDLHRRENVFGRAPAFFGLLFWIAMTVGVVASALVFAAVGGRQLSNAADTLTARTVSTIVAALLLWIGVPVLAVLLMLTLIGIPLGIGLVVFLLPALWFLGYITTGTRLGAAITRIFGRTRGEHPYLSAATGVLAFQLLVLVPVLGFLMAVLAGLWGAGALALVAAGAARRPAAASPTASVEHPTS